MRNRNRYHRERMRFLFAALELTVSFTRLLLLYLFIREIIRAFNEPILIMSVLIYWLLATIFELIADDITVFIKNNREKW